MSNLNKEAVLVQCTRPDSLPDGTHCNYRWSTKSKLHTISCPDCRYPNNKEKAMKRAKESIEEEKRSERVETPESPIGEDHGSTATP